MASLRLSVLVTSCLLIPFTSSQASTSDPTNSSTPAPTTAEETFFAASALEIIILVGIIIGCPILIAVCCKWQRSKTEHLILQRKQKDDELMRNVMERKEIQMANRQRQISAMQQHHQLNAPRQLSRPPSSSLDEGASSREDAHTMLLEGKPGGKKSSKGVPPPPSDDEAAPPPPCEAPPKEALAAAKRRKQREEKKSGPRAIRQQSTPLRAGKNKEKLNVKSKFQKIASMSDVDGIMSAPVESALILPDVEEDVDDAPPSMIPTSKTFDPETGVPMAMNEEPTDELELSLSVKVDVDEEVESDKAEKRPMGKTDEQKRKSAVLVKKSDGTFSSKGVPPPPAADKKVKEEKKEQREEPKKETKEPVASKAEVKEKGNDVVLDMLAADDEKDKEQVKLEDSEKENESEKKVKVQVEEEKEKEKGGDKKPTHQPEESPAPPDLETIFGRQVTKQDVESESEDSLMKRQEDFLQNPDAAAAMADAQDAESQLVLNV